MCIHVFITCFCFFFFYKTGKQKGVFKQIKNEKRVCFYVIIPLLYDLFGQLVGRHCWTFFVERLCWTTCLWRLCLTTLLDDFSFNVVSVGLSLNSRPESSQSAEPMPITAPFLFLPSSVDCEPRRLTHFAKNDVCD